MTVETRGPQLARGVLDMCVLGLLVVEPTHTYALVERLRERGFADVGYGTLYPLVTRLRRQELVTDQSTPHPSTPHPSTPRASGPPRRVLTVTPAGRETLRRWRRDWDEVVTAAAAVLAGLDEVGRA